MAVLLEFCQGLAAHAMGGAVRQDDARLLLQSDELRLQGVVLPVGDQRRVLHIVGTGVCVEPIYQLLHAF